MNHQCETMMLYTNAKGEEFLVLREWDGEVGYFIKRSNGRRGYGKFWTAKGYKAGRKDIPAYFTRTAMNGRSGLVEKLTPVQETIQRVNVPTISLAL